METENISIIFMENEYKSQFDEIDSIGSGGFSTVFEAKSFKDENYYAIKKIPFTVADFDKTLKEIQFLCKLESDFTVRIENAWIELNYYIESGNQRDIDPKSLLCDPEKPVLLHIQMELCSFTLDEYIKLSNYSAKNELTEIQYCIACQILTQLLECVQYLHSQTPPIIHRDLKPANIMIKRSVNERCVKLTDFGLSTYYEFVDQSFSKYVGTRGYRAPEVDINGQYNTKADIYSLGRIMEDLFNINHNRNSITDKTPTKSKVIKKISIKCLNPIANKRPNCEKLLKEKNSWTSNLNISEHLYDNILDTVINSKLNYIKWPLLSHLDFKFLKQLSFISIIDEIEEHALFVTEDNQSYSLRISEHIDSSSQTLRFIEQLSNNVIVKVVCGESHVLCLTENKTVYSFGSNEYGQLGNQRISRNNTPKIISELINESIIDIDCGTHFSAALNEYGKVFTWGCGGFGQIGNDCCDNSLTPTKLNSFNNEKIVSISCGGFYCLALSERGKLYGWGNNEFGQLGTGNNSNHFKPVLISLELNKNIMIKKISCGRNHSLVLTIDNEIYGFGHNDFGQLGIGDDITQYRPTKIRISTKFINIKSCFNDDMCVGLDEHNNYYVWGNCTKKSINYPLITKYNSFNEAFNNESIHNKLVETCFNKISNIELEKFITQFKAFQNINRNLLSKISCLCVIRLKQCKAIFVNKDDIVQTFGMNYCDGIPIKQINIIPELSSKRITKMLCGINNVICLNERKQVFSFGINEFAVLGNGSRINNHIPSIIQALIGKNIIEISRGELHCLALTETGELYSWGDGNYGQLGCGSNLDQLSPIKIEDINFKDISSICCGGAHSIALSRNGNLFGWGSNKWGQLGIGNNIDQNKPSLISLEHNIVIQKISCGANHTLLLTNNGDVYSFGFNKYGQLGIGNKFNQNKMGKIETKLKFCDIYASCYDFISAGLSHSRKYYVWGYCDDEIITSPKYIPLRSFDEIFSKYSRYIFTVKQIKFHDK